MDARTGLSYGDVLLVPQRSPVESRQDIDLSTQLTPGIELSAPVLSAAMDTVTGAESARELSRLGGMGVVHRFNQPGEQAEQVREVVEAGERATAAVGINEDYRERVERLHEAGVTAVVVDVAHGHMEACLDVVNDIAETYPDLPLVAGNVATPAGVRDLAAAGADCVKVGIGPGSHCTTREVAGAGVPQLTAVDDCAPAADERGVRLVADGGIRKPGDAAKALMAGADTVMLGSYFAGTDEAPGAVVERDGERYKVSRGMASTAANEARSDKNGDDHLVDEGVERLTPYRGPLADQFEELTAGIRSGLSYCGGHTIEEARENAEFIEAAGSAKEREGEHRLQ